MIVLMEDTIIAALLALLGLCMGSFAGATVWRLRARQLIEDKASGEKVDKAELAALRPITKAKLNRDRSHCLHCGHRLAWFDLVPLFSWISLRGKCRYCRKPIGWFEPLIELGTAALFVVSYLFWPDPLGTPGSIVQFGLWLIAGVMLVILFAYDLKWFLLPDAVTYPFIGLAVLIALLHIIILSPAAALPSLLNLAVAAVILSGIYFVIWIVSKGQWIGFGDVKLGLGLALLLGDWQLAFLALFAANFIGCIIVIPGMLAGKITKTTRVPFGPLLILGGIIALLFGRHILDFYMQSLI